MKEFETEISTKTNDSLIGYWQWFFGRQGYKRLLNAWLLLHLFIGTLLAIVVAQDLKTASNAVLLPLAGILVGLSFAWAGNAQVLMQTNEIDRLSEFHEGGFVEYVFVFQTAILAILVTLVLWGLAGLDVFDEVWPTRSHSAVYFMVKTLLFSMASLTVRECWHVVMGANWMLRIQREIRRTARKGNRTN